MPDFDFVVAGAAANSPWPLSNDVLFVSGDLAPAPETQPPGMAREAFDVVDSCRVRDVGDRLSGSASAEVVSTASSVSLTGARRDKLGLCIALGSMVLMKF